MINRRQMIKGIGAAICAGSVPMFVPQLVGGTKSIPTLMVAEGQLLVEGMKPIAVHSLSMVNNFRTEDVGIGKPFVPGGNRSITMEVELTEEGKKLFEEIQPNTPVSVGFDGRKYTEKDDIYLSFV